MAGLQREHVKRPAQGTATILIVLIHGPRGSPDSMAGLAHAAREAFPDATTYSPRMRYRGLFSLVRPEEVATDLMAELDELIHEQPFERIIFVGHSTGSLIARKIVILAHGETADGDERDRRAAPFEDGLDFYREPRAWAPRIERLVLMAGMIRGWSNNAAQKALIGALWALYALVGDMLVNGRWTLLRVRVGAPFVVQTRLQWLALMRRADPPTIATIQLLGSRDDTVAPEDTVDFLTDIARGRFVLLELPHTDHPGAKVVIGSRTADERRRRFIAALVGDPVALGRSNMAIPAGFVTNGPPPTADTEVHDVVFVIHGIRDRGFWTQKIAHKVMAAAEGAGRVARSMTLSYGYLAMGPFLLPWIRRDKVRWLMDRYADTRALYPCADFHFVGHSNGTYLAARALRDYPAARFRRVVFAGSVVRPDYDWRGLITGAGRQVEAVLNYVATRDWVVAIFPNGVSPFRRFDLGGAGHHGFDHLRDPSPAFTSYGARISRVKIGTCTSHQVDYVVGGHGAGIKESQWDDIARFVVHGTPPLAEDRDFTSKQRRWVRASAWLPPLAFAIVVAAAVAVVALATGGGAVLGAWLIGGPAWISGAVVGAWIGGALAGAACLGLIYLVITRL